MRVLKYFLKNFLLVIFICSYLGINLKAEETNLNAVIDQIQIITKDLKTLEKAVYKSSDVSTSSSSSNLNEDVLTKHLLKLNEIEEEFRNLTNRFEEINFKMDKLSNRVTKIQSDTQLRFSDLESADFDANKQNKKTNKQKAKLPGSDKAQDFGAAPGYDTSNLPKKQETQ